MSIYDIPILFNEYYDGFMSVYSIALQKATSSNHTDLVVQLKEDGHSSSNRQYPFSGELSYVKRSLSMKSWKVLEPYIYRVQPLRGRTVRHPLVDLAYIKQFYLSKFNCLLLVLTTNVCTNVHV